jgi:serine/threonine protein kinase
MLAPGTKLGPYEILAPLGAGGMGEVYRARDAKLNRDVAIKILPEALAADAVALARFEREAQAVAALSHPNILAIFDFGVERGTSFAVMELLDGQTLRDQMGGAAVPPARRSNTRCRSQRVSGPRTHAVLHIAISNPRTCL